MANQPDAFLLCIDNGGTYIKAALFDVHGQQIGLSKRFNHVLRDGPDRVEYNQDDLWQTNCQCIRDVIDQSGIDPRAIACAGFAGQGKGLYLVDERGLSFRNAITSSDARAFAYCQKWQRDGTSERLFDKLYQHAHPGQPVSILAWMKDHEPAQYARIRWVFSMKDYLHFCLTGRAVAGKGSQSGSCMVNLNTGAYDGSLLAAYGISEVAAKLPPMAWDTEITGCVSEAAAAQCGLCPGTPVSAGMFDVDAAALAMGVIDPEPIFMICGTHGINGYISPRPVTNRTVMLNSLYSLPGAYLIEEGSPSSAGVLEWVIDLLFDRAGEAPASLYGQVNRMVREAAGPAGLIFLPYLNGSGDCALARGAWLGLSQAQSKGDMLRAVYEGVAFAHRMQIEKLLKNRERPQSLLMAGGATRSEIWVQIFSDALGFPIEVVAEEEMGAKGVAIASAAAAGLYPDIQAAVQAMKKAGRRVMPNPERTKAYQTQYEAFREAASKMSA